MTSVDPDRDSYAVNVTASGGTVFEDGNNWRIFTVTVVDAADRKRPPPAVDLNALARQGVAIPQHIADLTASRNASDPIAPVTPDGTFDFPLVMDGNGYLLDGLLNTLVPHVVTSGQEVEITFTVYSQNDLAHFALYLNLQGNDADYSNSDTHVTYRNDGTVRVADPHGYASNATITVTQDREEPEKKTVTVTIRFGEPMGNTNMVAYLWDTDAGAVQLRIFDALDVVPEAALATVDPETCGAWSRNSGGSGARRA